ncbi:hypothetical protein NBRC13296_12700 [Paenibacillus chitinolyticus]|uniref:hypothetical protein n=1 Tax=Paenibacillus chitinolyticus TaxID=79263 RepID=UPI003557D1EA
MEESKFIEIKLKVFALFSFSFKINNKNKNVKRAILKNDLVLNSGIVNYLKAKIK